MSTQLLTTPLEFAPATRLQESLVAGAEKRALLWMAKRTPDWVNSDHLTVMGFLGQCLAGVCYALARWDRRMLLVGIACLALNWLGDSLDGTVARVRNRQRPRYGFYVDHITDTFAAFFLMGGMAMSGYVSPFVVVGMLIVFLMLSIEVYLSSYTLGKFRLSYWIFGPTEIRIALAIGNVALLYHPMVKLWGNRLRLFDVGGVISIAGMALMLIVSAIHHTVELYRQEKIA